MSCILARPLKAKALAHEALPSVKEDLARSGSGLNAADYIILAIDAVQSHANLGAAINALVCIGEQSLNGLSNGAGGVANRGWQRAHYIIERIWAVLSVDTHGTSIVVPNFLAAYPAFTTDKRLLNGGSALYWYV
jgi:hypothetical protein